MPGYSADKKIAVSICRQWLKQLLVWPKGVSTGEPEKWLRAITKRIVAQLTAEELAEIHVRLPARYTAEVVKAIQLHPEVAVSNAVVAEVAPAADVVPPPDDTGHFVLKGRFRDRVLERYVSLNKDFLAMRLPAGTKENVKNLRAIAPNNFF